ncbi:MAG TPA: zinc ABC transporter substrate-binding protein [Trebonia sp.]|jgi:zinc/manganese transport system substrate-binding protein|nr:zinc ABC transporter substrate-binding protein [Trebonia sp.]
MLLAIAAALVATAVLAVGSGGGPAGAAGPVNEASTAAAKSGVIDAIGAENQYANVIAQVGGRYVHVGALLSNPSTDPHTFEASVTVAKQVGQARLVVQNGLGYDSFMNSIEAAAPSADRKVIDVQRLLGLPDSTPNPHLWYDPGTMPKVATAVARDLTSIEPAYAGYFQANARKFAASLGAWRASLEQFARTNRNVKFASTEPVADYLLQAAGAENLTPWSFQTAVMNGTDPSPQDVATEKGLLSERKVSALIYNEQVTDPLTESLIALAGQEHIPVVGVYETMPEPGYDYQSWMLAETSALRRAVADHTSAEHL